MEGHLGFQVRLPSIHDKVFCTASYGAHRLFTTEMVVDQSSSKE